jgi:hypothetical protein
VIGDRTLTTWTSTCRPLSSGDQTVSGALSLIFGV